MNRDKEHCTDSHNECPVIRFIEDVLQVKLLPYQKLLVIHVFETNECKRINLCCGLQDKDGEENGQYNQQTRGNGCNQKNANIQNVRGR